MWQQMMMTIREEIQNKPRRVNYMLRLTLICSLVITISMTLSIPFLSVSLIIAFFVTQQNNTMTMIMGGAFLITVFVAIGLSALVIKFTFEYPLIRLCISSLIFFIAIFLMRVVRKLGALFFPVALVVIYAQTFPELTQQAELTMRLLLWVWIAASYTIVLTVIVNHCFYQASSAYQFKKVLPLSLLRIQKILNTSATDISNQQTYPSLFDVIQLQETLQTLFKFSQKNEQIKQHREFYQKHIAIIVKLNNATAKLSVNPIISTADQGIASTLGEWVEVYFQALQQQNTQLEQLYAQLKPLNADNSHPVLIEIETLLLVAFEQKQMTLALSALPKEPILVEDAFSNPIYARFALKTLLATLLCYVFYMGTAWNGIHTVMLTCVICAQVGLGATIQRVILRVGGVILGSVLVLFCVVFIQPHTDSILGLLLMCAPVMALGAWLSAGSERINYVGVQLMFTFSVALLGTFYPSTDLVEIRDRILGIFIGVIVSVFFSLAFWRDSEISILKEKLAKLYQSIAQHLKQTGDILSDVTLMQVMIQSMVIAKRVSYEELSMNRLNKSHPAYLPIQETYDLQIKLSY